VWVQTGGMDAYMTHKRTLCEFRHVQGVGEAFGFSCIRLAPKQPTIITTTKPQPTTTGTLARQQ